MESEMALLGTVLTAAHFQTMSTITDCMRLHRELSDYDISSSTVTQLAELQAKLRTIEALLQVACQGPMRRIVQLNSEMHGAHQGGMIDGGKSKGSRKGEVSSCERKGKSSSRWSKGTSPF